MSDGPEILQTAVSHQKATTDLKRHRERRQALVEHALDAYVEIGPDGLIREWNPQAEQLFGWLREEALGQRFSQSMIAAGDADAYDKAVARFFGPGKGFLRSCWLETTALARDRVEFPIELFVFPMGEDGSVHMGAFVRDFTRDKKIEEEAQARNRALMDQLGEAYNESDLQGNYVFLSKPFREIYRPTYGPGQGFEDVFEAKVVQLLRDGYQEIYRSGKPAALEYERHYQDGRPSKFIENSGALRRDRHGKPIGFLSVSFDCTQRRQSELELAKAKEAAEAASKAKSEFLANMSHEIRTPLNGVLGMLELASDSNLTAEQKELLEMARSSGTGLLAVINDILDFSKIEAGNLEFDCIQFDVTEVLAQAVSTIAVVARKKGLALRHTVVPGVPQFFRGDPVRLKQVLINLLGNAVKFTESGAVTLVVKCTSSTNGNAELLFSVSDTGIGIPPEKQKLIFEAFSQADASTTRKFGGTGLGLAISACLVQLMGGKIWVESQSNQGSVFHFTAVLETAQHAQPAVKEFATAIRTKEVGEQFTILLAEDNPVNQKLIVRLLEKLGHRVVVANNGKEALGKLEGENFDLVLMDIQMPEMDGFAATAAIRALENPTKANLPIVAVTAHAMKEDRGRCLAAGMNDYLAKPVNFNQLKQTIERAMLRLGISE